MTLTEAVHQLGWRIEGSWIIIDGDGKESGEALAVDDFLRIAALVTPQWRRGEWQQDEEIFRKYAIDADKNCWVIDLPSLP